MTTENEVQECLNAMHDCKHCGGRPKAMFGGGLLTMRLWWECKGCGAHPEPARGYVKPYDRWQKMMKPEKAK